MPFVRIDVMKSATTSAQLDALGRAVRDAMVETIGIPPDDWFQVLTAHDGTTSTLRYDGYYGIPRDDGIVFIAITMRAGRTHEQKQNLYRRTAELAREYAGTEPRNVFITVTENQSADWSLGDGLAQYVAPSEADAS
jgi:phenylpyruvate tautomerase PptA (4-oxalocrotonate tautomerase family)